MGTLIEENMFNIRNVRALFPTALKTTQGKVTLILTWVCAQSLYGLTSMYSSLLPTASILTVNYYPA
jgi:hypothetical protein